LQLARAQGQEEIYSNKSARAILIGLLDFWLENDFRNEGWWFDVVLVPRQLLAAAIMLEPYLLSHQRRKLKSIVLRGVLHPCQNYEVRSHQGANNLDLLHNTLSYAIFQRKTYLILKVSTLLQKELSFTRKNKRRRGHGVQKDYSFFQHGPQLMTGSYGLNYFTKSVAILNLLNGTNVAIHPRAIDFLSTFLLEGIRYAVHTKNSHYLTNGRSFSRPNGESLKLLEQAVETLLQLKPTRFREIENFLLLLHNQTSSFSSVKYFPLSFFLASLYKGSYIAVQGGNQKIINSEYFNGENVLGRNLGYGGVTTYQYTGLEYANISSVWDFSMLPGSTAYHETDEELRAVHKSLAASALYRSTTRHSGGGVSNDGLIGALFTDLENEEGLYSRQFYVTNGRGLVVCLGNSVTNLKAGNQKPIFTTIDQTYAKNPYYNNSILVGTRDIAAGHAIYNSAFAYYDLGDSGGGGDGVCNIGER
jgi:hypothetical protein